MNDISAFQHFLSILKDKNKPKLLIFCSIYPNSLLAASIFINYCKMQKGWIYQVTFDDPVYFYTVPSKISLLHYDAVLYIDLLPSSVYTHYQNLFHIITTIKIFVNNGQQQIFPKTNKSNTKLNISIVSTLSIAEFIANAINKIDPTFIISGNISELWIYLSYYYLNYNSKESEALASSIKTKFSSNTSIVFDEGYFQFPIGLTSSLFLSLKTLNKSIWPNEKQISQFLATNKITNMNTPFSDLPELDQNMLIEKIILHLTEENYDPFLYLQPLWKLQNPPKNAKFRFGSEIITFLINFIRIGMPGKALEFLLNFPNHQYDELQDINLDLIEKIMLFEQLFIMKKVEDRPVIDILHDLPSIPNMDLHYTQNIFRIGWMFGNLLPAIIVSNSYIFKSNLLFPIIRINILHGSDIEKELSSLLNEHSKKFNIHWTMRIENEFLLPYTTPELLNILNSLSFKGGFCR